MPVTPSLGLDQNREAKFMDRYWGRVPQFLLYMPESFACEINPDYVELMNLYIIAHASNDQAVIDKFKDNISKELYAELSNIMLNLDCPCLLTGKERAIIEGFYGNDPCARPSHMLNCTETVCCNEIISCESETICT